MLSEQRKRKRRCQFDCKDHIFSIQTLKANSSKYDIKLQFCPKYQRDPLPPQHTYPEYNNDFKFYTSAFILGVDQRQLIKNQQQELMDHQKQIRDSLQKHNQLVFPRPNSKHSLCSVCKQHYKNYYFHIASQEHRERIGFSPYNNHIKQICSIYLDLWQGAEERADEQAQKRALQEEQKRQRMAQASLLQMEDHSNSLADCQRGEDPEELRQYQQFAARQNHGRKPSSRTIMNNEDTIPITGRAPKRANAESRSAYEPAMRKRYTAGQFNPCHAARERKQRQYERERDKMMKGTEFQHYKKMFVAREGQEEDVFIIMQPVKAVMQLVEEQSQKKNQQQKNIKKPLEQTPKKIAPSSPPFQDHQQQQESLSSQSSSSSNSSSNSFFRSLIDRNQLMDMKKNIDKSQSQKDSVQEGQLSDSCEDLGVVSKATEKIITNKRTEGLQRKSLEHPEWKMDPRMHGYPYPYPPMHMSGPHPPLHGNQLGQPNKGANSTQPPSEHYKNMPEGYKGPSPYYYNPYAYPMYDPQYTRHSEKGYQFPPGEKQKGKGHQKPYQYPMHYPWPYHPYYMPPMQSAPPSQHSQPTPQTGTQHPALPPPPAAGVKGSPANPNSPYVGSTSININFPMYMCPPHPSMPSMSYPMPSSRYPMHPMMGPYMGYQYGPYMNQQQRNGREGDYPPGQQPPPQHPGQHTGSQHPSLHPAPLPGQHPGQHPPPHSQPHPQQYPQGIPPQYAHNHPQMGIPPHNQHLAPNNPQGQYPVHPGASQASQSALAHGHHPPPYYYPSHYQHYQNQHNQQQLKQQKTSTNKDS